MIVGLTGESGAGKTTASEIFAQHGFYVINADAAARKVTERGSECLHRIAEEFGSDVLLPDGSMDRRRVAGIVFSDKVKLHRLLEIEFPYIKALIADEIRCADSELILLDAPTLFDAQMENMCDKVISVIADDELRLGRITERDGISAEEAAARFSAQRSKEFFINNSDFVLDNSGTEKEFREKAETAAEMLYESGIKERSS